MSFSVPGRGQPRQPVVGRRRRGALVPTLVVLGVVVVLFGIGAQLGTEVLWYQSIGFTEVFTTRLLTQAALFVVAALVMFAAVLASLMIAWRSRPIYAPVSTEQQSLDRYRDSVEPLRKLVTIAVPIGLAMLAGSAATSQWQTVLLWWNRTSFGREDAQFGMDVSFFVFTLPWLNFLLSFVTAVVVLSAIAAVVTHYLYGGLRLQGGGERTTKTARIHLSVLAGVFVLLRAAGYWMDRYGLATQNSANASTSGGFTGLSYTDAQAVLPARSILAVIAVICALLFFATAFTGSWKLPAAGAGLLVVSAIVVGGIYPQVVQRFQVRPSAATLESDYIERSIAATRDAYGIDEVETIPYDATTTAEAGQLAADAGTLPGIRLLDPALVSESYAQLQQIRQYYAFADNLDVDRYEIDGELRDTVVAVRELNLGGVPQAQRNWVNDHTVYTHGYGVVAAYGNERAPDGQPAFFQGGIPSEGALGDFEPRVYYGENTPDFSIVGAPADAPPRETDYPDDTADSGEARTTYTGEGGVPIGSLWQQLLYAVALRDQNIVLADAVNSESKIIYDRDPRERVEKVAPFLTLDGDPYPAVVDGRVQWIVDGYTTSDSFPYSSLQTLDDATQDTQTATSNAVTALAPDEINYIRNSVKATVDAYDGTVTLYEWDSEDPVLQAWKGVFPDLVQPLSEVSGDLMGHFRYPEDLFKVQRELLTRYHVEDAATFFSGQDFWQVPVDPTADEGRPKQPPYYLTLRMPGADEAAFSLTSTFIPTGGGRNVLTGFVAVDAEPGREAGQKRDGYGQFRILELPGNSTVPGPGQAQNNFDADPEVGQALNLLRQGDTQVQNGNLLTLPVGGGLLYVQPVYVRSQGETSYPLLQRVLVSFGNDIGFAPTLDEALDQVFGGDAGADAADADVDVEDAPTTPPTETPSDTPTDTPTDGAITPTPTPTETSTTTPAPPVDGDLGQALADAQQAIEDGQAALAENDFAAYGEAQDRLEAALQRAIEAEGTG